MRDSSLNQAASHALLFTEGQNLSHLLMLNVTFFSIFVPGKERKPLNISCTNLGWNPGPTVVNGSSAIDFNGARMSLQDCALIILSPLELLIIDNAQ